MGFNLLDFVNKFLGGLDVPDIGLKASTWLEENGEKYPDTKELTSRFAGFLSATIAEAAPNLDPATMVNTIKGIAEDIIAGRSGVDPDAGNIMA